MANRTFYPSQSYGSSRVYMEFEFQVNSTGAVDQTTITGCDGVASVTRTAVGTFKVILKDTFNRIIHKSAELDDSNDGYYASAGLITNENTSTPIQFYVFTRTNAGTLTDCVAGRRVHVSVALRNGNWGVK